MPATRCWRLPEQIDVIAFDLVGTLIHASPGVIETYFRAGQAFGSKASEADVRRRFKHALANVSWAPYDQSAHRRGWRSIVEQVFDDVMPSDDLFQQLWNHFAQASAWAPYPEVPNALAALRRGGYRLVVASNFDDRLTTIAAAHPLFEHFETLYYATRLKCAKPDARFYHQISAMMGVPADSMLMVGDDVELDYQAPQRAGWQAVLLDRSRADRSQAEATTSLTDLQINLDSNL